ncbi:hypothetical protein LTR37_013525 [Vermiconidia calcicola]|uniref:Uncharacterized protein n=1 Tax=Vermiconidia calcicola TaxID=1690605 RepID=A0ACC3MW88_9PEZI|nr:hypothetical protein LTR37_013525 [Vermiconidia calcicola]
MASLGDQQAPSSETTSSAQRAADESDLDPAAFLKSVRELSEKREREDAERYRKLEEEIEKGRQERAARRAERERSISPEKANVTPTNSLRPSINVDTLSTPPAMTPPASSTPAMRDSGSASPTKDIPEFKGFGSNSRTLSGQTTAQQSEPPSSASTPSRTASSLARSGTLSWQQRPSSRGGGSRPRSMFIPESNTQASSTAQAEAEPSRDQIAASLGSRDPSWFRQTADRGAGNAAYRRSKEETTPGENTASGRRGLPGMSRESSIEPARRGSPARAESVTSETTSRTGSVRDSNVSSSRFSTTRTSTSSKPDLRSLIAADEEQVKSSPMSEETTSITDGDQSGFSRTMTMSSSQARLGSTIERPSSPTKGMGGFVQSAMLRRSDSATKRWSAQPGSSVSRQNSVTSARSGYGGLTGSHSMPRLEPTSNSREASNEPASRPTSSSSNLTNLTTTQTKDDKDIFIKPALPRTHSRSKSVASNYSTTAEEGHTSPPSSPSKRWSPTKSSWLESAITKPDSPKPAAAARNSQPSWMSDIAKAKAQRASGDSTPKPAEDTGSRPSSPMKPAFGQGMLKRSESRDLDVPRIGTPNPAEERTSRPPSPIKPGIGRSDFRRSDSSDLKPFSATLTPTAQPRSTGSTSESIETTRSEPPLKNTSEADSKEAMVPSLAGKSTASSEAEPSEVQKPSTPVKAPAPSASTTLRSAAPPIKMNGLDEEATTPKDSKTSEMDKPSAPVKAPSTSIAAKSKPDTPPKPPTDFRSNLRSRGPSEVKQQNAPEFLSKFGNLKKASTQNYVAPDVLKDNILRGKGDLAKTGGPVKTQRRDELKESLLAKKDQWKKEKEEGVVHERKISNPPQTPQKPEALAKRELLSRSDSTKVNESTEKPKIETPEALARQRSLKEQPKSESSLPALEKQTSAPSSKRIENVAPTQPQRQMSTPATSTGSADSSQPTQTSRMAARFNPGLAGILARGPPTTTNGSDVPSRSGSPAMLGRSKTPVMTPSSEPPAEGGQLQDVRKGRAKGPKRRKGGARDTEDETMAPLTSESPPTTSNNPSPVQPSAPRIETAPEGLFATEKPKPQAPPGSAASLMRASLQKSPAPRQKQTEPEKPATPVESSAVLVAGPREMKPSVPTKSPSFSSTKQREDQPAINTRSPATTAAPNALPDKAGDHQSVRNDVPEFKGFRAAQRPGPSIRVEDDKENVGESSPSVKSVASMWSRQPQPKKSEPPAQIQMPSRKDEEAAMRSAGLLASSPSRPGSSNGLGISVNKNENRTQTPPAFAGGPPKPSKPSRAVSGQLQEASLNKDTDTGEGPPDSYDNSVSEVSQRLSNTFGSVPNCTGPLSIDAHALVASSPHQQRVFRTIRKVVLAASRGGSLKQLPPQEEYTFFDECVYVCQHAYSVADGPKRTEIFRWTGDSSSEAAVEQAQNAAKKLAKEAGSAPISTLRQGFEPPGFLQALGGILVTRRGSREGAPKQYMLCGRKHLGQIVFDEMDFGVGSLCSGYAYLVSYPITLQETKLYLWKGSACSAEEISAARLAAMDLSETGEMIEVDDGAELASFLKVFGLGTSKASIPKPTELWQQKAVAPHEFACRLFAVQQAPVKQGGFTSFFTRRPSWNSLSPARRQSEDIKVEAKEISPFTQSDLEADAIYLLDAHSQLYILIGPMFPSLAESTRDLLLAQTLFLASEHALLAASAEDRPSVPKTHVLLAGVPSELKMLFRHWDDSSGLWGTGGLMAGGNRQTEAEMLALEEVLEVVGRD